ncbi:amidohydrolase [Massilia sp. TS11]|uniref:amidohydrolase n=1 Tax=Massilia sp. TS11 TaxID=2908003 RepID=UPI001EDA1E3B|nr:amidohydrolase [Massilia sp. TS11]MCG2586218.1 amidohydrolase [Massilia sp. TS11]
MQRPLAGWLTRLCLAVAAAATLPALAADPEPLFRPSYFSTYAAPSAAPVLLKNATILTGSGARLDGADLLLADGKVAAIGKGLSAPAGAQVIDASGRWITPGLIDPHSHLGDYASPGVWAHADGNEMTSPTTPQVWAEHAVWPQDPGFLAARAGGVTSMVILPGSGNLIGGRGVLLKNVPATTYQGMKFPGAPQVLKMACGENPKRVYGEGRKQAPMTLMGNVAGYREAFTKAVNYREKRRAWDKEKKGAPPDRDIGMETLVEVLDGKILVEMHCYRADQMATMLDVAKEFNFKISAFHHAVEAYKIAPLLRETNTCAVMWADWYGFKMESFDGIRENIAIVDAVGACATLHSDSAVDIQHLNQEAAKAMAAGQRAGIGVAPEKAISWITLNPARAIGMDGQIGSLDVGKNADVVLWSANPFSIFAKADLVFIDGIARFDRRRPNDGLTSDFSVGTTQR